MESSQLENVVSNEHGDIVKCLISSMENLEISKLTEQDLGSIHITAANGEDNILESLIAKGVDINMQDIDGNTCLHLAAKNNHKSTVDLLISKGINLDIRNKKGGYTAISEALDAQNIDIFYKLWKAGADLTLTDDKGYTLLHTACKVGSKEIVEKLVNEHEELINMKNETCVTALHEAACNGHLEIVKFLVGRNVNIIAKTRAGYTPLIDAVKNNHLAVVTYLLDSGADIEDSTNKGGTVLHFAALNGYKDMLEYIVSKNRNLIFKKNRDGHNALHVAVNHNHLDSVKSLIRLGADVTAKTNLGTTPLEFAAFKGNIEIINELTKDDKSVNLRTTKGESAIQIALLANHIHIAKYLKQLMSAQKLNSSAKIDSGKIERREWRK